MSGREDDNGRLRGGVVVSHPREQTSARHRRGAAPKRRIRISNKPVYVRRRRIAYLILSTLVLLPVVLVAYGLSAGSLQRIFAPDPVSRMEPPLISTAPVAVGGKEENYATPEDKKLLLTIPKLGLYGNAVVNDDSPEALDTGAIKLPSTGFPWQDNANTYISGHRIGYRDTESYYQFLELPSMKKGDEVILEDAKGQRYVYNVTKVFAVEPTDVWVTDPVPGKDMITLQTCTESVEDWQTLGPELLYSTPDTGRLIVRAERVT